MARGLMLIATFVVLGYTLKATGLSDLVDTGWIDSQVKGRGLSGEVIFVAVGAVFTAVGLPRQLICFLAGYAFDLALGTALALVASVAGCVVAFAYARLLGRAIVKHRFPRRIAALDNVLHGHPLSMTLLIRLLPVGSNLITNLAAGVSSVRPLPFIVGSALGYVPQTVVFALAGSGVQLDAELRIAVSAALFVVSGILGVMLYRRYRKTKALDAVTGDAP
ncbi:TVP38/TMEM64 family inner membrane protein ydjZ [Blastochloris viridis]|nr:TVP38/TMEM64 family inner membrane protein ydjZ [Blastochloris viridis]